MVCLGLATIGCSDKDPDDPTNDSGGFWVVGERGAVLNVTVDDSVEEPSPEPTDLAAITCYGNDRAWYVGANGAASTTEDGGKNWLKLDLGIGEDLHDVASSDPLQVAIAGDRGTLLLSQDGYEFQAIAGASGSLTGVDLTPEGLVAVAENGSIWVHQTASEQAAEVARFEVPLHAVDFGDHTPIGAAVGDNGLLVWSEDGGYTWTQRATTTYQNLRAVQVSMSGDEAIAVGDAGVVVRISGQSIEAETVALVDLQAVHLDAWGHGAVVGHAGVVLHTEDIGHTFREVTVSEVNLLGVDALGERHW